MNFEGTEIVSKGGNSSQTDSCEKFRYYCGGGGGDNDDDDDDAKVQNIRHAQ